MGSAVRAEVLWLPARPRLPGRDHGDLPDGEGQVLETSVGAGRGPVGGVRPHRPRPPDVLHRPVPRQGPDPGLAEGGRDRPRPVRTDRGGNSPRRCDQPAADERCSARTGTGRRVPILGAGRARARRGTRHPGAGEVCRRLHRALPRRGRGAPGQGPAGGMAGAERSSLQRGEDQNRPSGRWVRLPRVHRPAHGRQADHQAEHGGLQEAPGATADRGEGPTWGQRRGRVAQADPDLSRLGGLLPGGGVHDDVLVAGPLHVAADLQMGQASPPQQVEALGSWPGTSASSTRPGGIGGCSATATAAPSCPS